MRIILLFLAATVTANCASVAGSCELLTIRDYDPAFTAKLVAEIRATPDLSATRVFFVDAVQLRDDVRNCQR